MSPPHPTVKRTLIQTKNNNSFSQNAGETELDHGSSKKRRRLLSFLVDIKNYQEDNVNLHVITCLDLSHCNLSEVPNVLKLLPLKELNVSYNNLTKVPTCLYHNGLADLEKLDLSYNAIEYFDVIPDCVGNIKILFLNNNRFSSLPQWILNFYSIKLDLLDYSDNRAKHYNFSDHVCNFNIMYLRELRLIRACLIDKDIRWLKCIKNLQYLDISNRSESVDLIHKEKCNNNFKELGSLFSYPRWKEMRTLKLSYLNIALFPKELFWVDTITELHLSNNLLSWIPDEIKYLIHLQILDVSKNQILCIPDTFGQLPNLTKFIAFCNHLDDLPILPKSLQYLDLYDNHLNTLRNIEIEQFSCIDLELNFINIEESETFFHRYSPKRDQMRTICATQFRLCGVKEFQEVHLFEIESCSSSEYNEFTFEEQQECTRDFVSSEDWDQGWNGKSERTPEVLSDDDEFTGADEQTNVSMCKMPRTVYFIDVNEQWIFEDAD